MHLILIETSGNQNYIFATNKLRENVGASELTYRVGTQWVLEAVEDAGGPLGMWPDDGDTSQLRRNLLDARRNRPITEDGVVVEVIVATSGKALLLVKEHEVGRRIVQNVTMKALEYAPGIDVCGVIEKFEWENESLHEANKAVHRKFEEVRSARPAPAMRFLRIPVVRECATSGLPAAIWHVPKEGDGIKVDARSAPTLAKWNFRIPYKDRMNSMLLRHGIRVKFAENVDTIAKQLEEATDWLAVIHADGNGLGQIFLDFGQHADCHMPDSNRSYAAANSKYVDALRRFSLALDLCTERAFMSVLKRWVDKHEWLKADRKGRLRLPLLPIVLGGDDLTVVCEGPAALQFTREFLNAFEDATMGGREGALAFNAEEAEVVRIVPTIAEAALGDARLSACAGIAIIKPHFPFSAAYELAEELIKSAKQVKDIVTKPRKEEKPQSESWPCSAIDFHVLYDTTASELDEIRRQLMKDAGRTKLHARPYVITPLNRLTGATSTGQEWAKNHGWEELRARVEAILQSDKDDEQRRSLPNSQLHHLRAGLFLGQAGANARYELISHRYDDDKLATLRKFAELDGGLFFNDRDSKNRQFCATKLLDAMDAANFWVREKTIDGGSGK